MLSFTFDAGHALAALDAVPGGVTSSVAAGAERAAAGLQNYIVTQKLSGQLLQRRSGTLADAIQHAVGGGPDGIVASVCVAGTVPYAAIQEFGGTTAPHDIVPVAAEALAFAFGGKQVFAKRVHHPGSHIPEHGYLRSSLAEQAGAILDALRGAAVAGARRAIGA